MPYNDDEIKNYAQQLQQKGASLSEISDFIKNAKQEQFGSQMPTEQKPPNVFAPVINNTTPTPKGSPLGMAQPQKDLLSQVDDTLVSAMAPINATAEDKAKYSKPFEAVGQQLGKASQEEQDLGLNVFARAYRVGERAVGGMGDLLMGAGKLIFSPVAPAFGTDTSVGVEGLNQLIGGATKVISSPLAASPVAEALVSSPFTALDSMLKNQVRAAGVDPESKNGQLIVSSLNNAVGLSLMGKHEPEIVKAGLEAPANLAKLPGQIIEAGKTGLDIGRSFIDQAKASPIVAAESPEAAMNLSGQYMTKAQKYAGEILGLDKKEITTAMANGTVPSAINTFIENVPRVGDWQSVVQHFTDLLDTTKQQKAKILEPVNNNALTESQKYTADKLQADGIISKDFKGQLPAYTDFLIDEIYKKLDSAHTSADSKAMIDYLNSELQDYQNKNSNIGWAEGRKEQLNSDLAKNYEKKGKGASNVFSDATETAMDKTRLGLRQEIEYQAGNGLGDVNAKIGDLMKITDAVTKRAATSFNKLTPNLFQQITQKIPIVNSITSGVTKLFDSQKTLEQLLKPRLEKIQRLSSLSDIGEARATDLSIKAADSFNNVVDATHDIVQNEMPDALKQRLIDIRTAERVLKTENVKKIITEKFDNVAEQNADFNKHMAKLKSDIANAEQYGKISVGQLHEIVQDFQKSTPSEMASKYVPAIKNSIVNYLLGEADRQTGGFVSQVYKTAFDKYFAEKPTQLALPEPISNSQGQTIQLPAQSESTVDILSQKNIQPQLMRDAFIKKALNLPQEPLLPSPTSNAQGETIQLPSRSQSAIYMAERQRLREPMQSPVQEPEIAPTDLNNGMTPKSTAEQNFINPINSKPWDPNKIPTDWASYTVKQKEQYLNALPAEQKARINDN